MFKSIKLDAKFEDIQDCFNTLKYIFPVNCKIKISVLGEVEKKRLDEEKLREEFRDASVSDSIIGCEKEKPEVQRQNLAPPKEESSQIVAEEVMRKKENTGKDEEEKSKIFSAKKKTAVKKKGEKVMGLKKKHNVIERTRDKPLDNDATNPEKKNDENDKISKHKVAIQNNIIVKIKKILKEGKAEGLSGLYIDKDFTREMKRLARKSCKIPESKTIFALLGLMKKNPAKDCLVFAKDEIYFHNPVFSIGPKKGSISYENFKYRDIKIDGEFEISLGNVYSLNVSIFKRDEKEIIKKILELIKNLFNSK